MIYYVFSKLTSEFAGSGTPFFDDEIYGCTEVATPQYDEHTQKLLWDGNNWTITEIENI